MSIEDTIKQAKAKGLQINNLAELPDGTYQANFTDKESCWEFARHKDPGVAVLLAFQATQGKPGVPLRKAKPTAKPQAHEPELNLDDLED